MNKIVLGLLLIVLVLSGAAVLFAAPPTAAKKTAPLTQVAVMIDGFHCQACADGLQKDLAKLPGVNTVKASLKPPFVMAGLDEHKITVSEFVNAISAHVQLMDKKKTYSGKLVAFVDTAMCAKEPKMCAACFTAIPKDLKGLKGVQAVTLDKTGKVAKISFVKGAKVTTAQIAGTLAKDSLKFQTNFTVCPGTKGGTSGAACPMGGSSKAGGACPMGGMNGMTGKSGATCPMGGSSKTGGACPMPAGKK